MSAISIIRPGEQVLVDPTGPGFAHGFGLFETIRLRQWRLELWEAHWTRLRHSANALQIECPFQSAEVLEAIRELSSDLQGEGTIKLSLLKEAEGVRLLVYSRSAFPLPEKVGLLVEGGAVLNETSELAGHKTHNYAENMLAASRAKAAGCYEVVRVNAEGVVAEAAMSNLFYVLGGQLRSPAEATGLLPGVVREALCAGLPVDMADTSAEGLLSAEAVYLTNSSVGVLPVDWLQSGGSIYLNSAEHPMLTEMQRVLDAALREKSALLA